MSLGGDGGNGCRGGSRRLFQQRPVGHRHAVRRTAGLLGRQGVRGRHVRRSRKRAPRQPLLGDTRLRGRKLLRRRHRRLHDGGRPRHGRGVRDRPPVPAAAALQPERVLRHVRGRGQRRSGRRLHGDRRLPVGPVVRPERALRRAEGRVPAVRGRDVHRRRRVPRVLRGAPPRQTAGGLLSPALPERHPRQRRRARHLRLPQARTDAAGGRPREAVRRHLDRRLRRVLRRGRHRVPLLGQHRLQQRHPGRRQDLRRDRRADVRHRVRAQLGHQQRQDEVFVQLHAGRTQHARYAVRTGAHVRGVRDDRPQVGHGRAAGRRR